MKIYLLSTQTQNLYLKNTRIDNNPKKISTTKIGKYTVCNYSSFGHCTFDGRKIKHNYYRGEKFMKHFQSMEQI